MKWYAYTVQIDENVYTAKSPTNVKKVKEILSLVAPIGWQHLNFKTLTVSKETIYGQQRFLKQWRVSGEKFRELPDLKDNNFR